MVLDSGFSDEKAYFPADRLLLHTRQIDDRLDKVFGDGLPNRTV